MKQKAAILSWDDEGIVYDYNTQQQTLYSGYNTKKYMLSATGTTNEVEIPRGKNWHTKAYKNIMTISFADVLLMGAELSGAVDGTTLTYLNRVRHRAFGAAGYTTLRHLLFAILLFFFQYGHKSTRWFYCKFQLLI